MEKRQGLDFMDPNDCTPKYSITDYMRILTQNHVIDENSFFREIALPDNSLTFQQIGRGTTKDFSSNPEQASNAFETLKTGVRIQEEIKEGQTQGEG